MDVNDITKDILDAAVKIHRRFGPGMLESVYEQILCIELANRGHSVECQKMVSFEYEGVVVKDAFRIDMLVDNEVLVELKSAENMHPVYEKQTLTYLKAMNLRVGLLINFGMALLRDGFRRIANDYQDARASASQKLCVSA